MKKLKDFEKEINKCSKCGLCQNDCPIFQLTGNECAVSKGKFAMLYGVIKGDLKLSKKINSYLDLCTKCGKCSKQCPAGINVCEIFTHAKYEFLQNKLSFKILRWLQSEFFFDKIIETTNKITTPIRRKNAIPNQEILYFKGCVNKIYPKTENALKKIFNKANITLTDGNFNCCGLPFFSSGNLERFENVVTHNSDIINNSNAKIILTDCASCQYIIKNYPNINKPVLNIENLEALQQLHFSFNKEHLVAFHEPCHSETPYNITKILNNCANINQTNIPKSCCGLAGEFTIKNPKLAYLLGKKRVQEILESKADTILTTCPACIFGLKKALWLKGKFNIKVKHLIEFLAEADKVEQIN